MWCSFVFLQIPNPKVVIFCPVSKIESKIRKIRKFQNDTEIALEDEFHRNLRQMEDLGLDFQKKLKFSIIDDFWMFFIILNIGQIRIFENDEKYQICLSREKKCSKIEKFIFQICFLTFFNSPRSTNSCNGFYKYLLDLEIKIETWDHFSDFPDFCPISLRNSLRKWGRISVKLIFEKFQ